VRGTLLIIEQTLAMRPKSGMPAEGPPPPAGRHRDGVQACGEAVHRPAISRLASGGQRHMIWRNVGVAPQCRLM
jgi:hypothetical protein